MDARESLLNLFERPSPKSSEDVRSLVRWLLVDQRFQLPFPGEGRTGERFRLLSMLGSYDLSLAKLVESHFDALAILHEAGKDSSHGIYGVWASKFGQLGLKAFRQPNGSWQVEGKVPFASGIDLVDHILIPADTTDGEYLFEVPHKLIRDREEFPWATSGMKDCNTSSAFIEGQLSDECKVGDKGFYLNRRGFWPGGAGVAACWYGATAKIYQDWCSTLKDLDRADPWSDASRGDAYARLHATKTFFKDLAERIDDSRESIGSLRCQTLALRHFVDITAREIIKAQSRSVGSRMMLSDESFSRRVHDLEIFVRQCHGDKDLAFLSKELDKLARDLSHVEQEVWIG